LRLRLAALPLVILFGGVRVFIYSSLKLSPTRLSLVGIPLTSHDSA
jgi:hypothetical protein